jgi:hypothetical protein
MRERAVPLCTNQCGINFRNFAKRVVLVVVDRLASTHLYIERRLSYVDMNDLFPTLNPVDRTDEARCSHEF